MDIKKIKYFIAVAEELHFGRAAQRLFISQPPLSFHIKALEEELGVQLFDRDRHSVKLTDAGTALLTHAREIMRMVPIAIDAARRAAHGGMRRLQIGYSSSAMLSDNILGSIANYRREHPSVEGLNVALIKRERLVVVVPRNHRLAQQLHVSLAELSAERFVVFQTVVGAALNQLLQGLFAQVGIEPTVSIEATGLLSVLGLVGIGTGITILPESVTCLNYPHVANIPLADANAYTELYLVTPAKPSVAARAFMTALSDHRSTQRVTCIPVVLPVNTVSTLDTVDVRSPAALNAPLQTPQHSLHLQAA